MRAAIDQLLEQFAQGLASTGDPTLLTADRRLRLELARHFGVPSPLIDFSFSPYVALWFAFDGAMEELPEVIKVRGRRSLADRALYAFNPTLGAMQFAKAFPDPSERIGNVPPIDFFRGGGKAPFATEMPMNVMHFLPYAASQNTRMVRQRGCFMYDTMTYQNFGVSSFDEFFGDDAVFEWNRRKLPALIKFVIPGRIVADVFNYLDAIGVDGAFLLADPSGVAADTKNMFNRRPRYWRPPQRELLS